METNGYPSKQYAQPTKRYVQVMNLKDDHELIRRYREAHDPEHFWREIGNGIKQVGILEMEIYISSNHLVMIVDAPLDFKWDEAMAHLATLKKSKIMVFRYLHIALNGSNTSHNFKTARSKPQATRNGKWQKEFLKFINYYLKTKPINN